MTPRTRDPTRPTTRSRRRTPRVPPRYSVKGTSRKSGHTSGHWNERTFGTQTRPQLLLGTPLPLVFRWYGRTALSRRSGSPAPPGEAPHLHRHVGSLDVKSSTTPVVTVETPESKTSIFPGDVSRHTYPRTRRHQTRNETTTVGHTPKETRQTDGPGVGERTHID